MFFFLLYKWESMYTFINLLFFTCPVYNKFLFHFTKNQYIKMV